MDLLLIHLVLLVWLSVWPTLRWLNRPLDRVLASGALVWANVLATTLALSLCRLLGEPLAFLVVSILLALAVGVCSGFAPPRPEERALPDGPHPGLQFGASASLVGLAIAAVVVAVASTPARPSALAYELPRVLMQIGEGRIFALPAGDARQVLPPFNVGLLHTWALVFQPPLAALNFFGVAAWCYLGAALYRLSRLVGGSANGALLAAWCGLACTAVLAYAPTADHGLPAVAALVAAMAFALDWRQTGNRGAAAWSGLLAGLAMGSTLTTLLAGAVCAGMALAARGWPRSGRWRLGLGAAFGLLPFTINLIPALGPGRDLLLASIARTAHATTALPLSLLRPWNGNTSVLPPNEDTIGIGLAGLACLGAAAWGLWPARPGARKPVWLSAIALGFTLVTFVASRWLPIDSSSLSLAVVLAAPSLALAWDRLPGTAWRVALGAAIALTTLGSSGLYAWRSSLNVLIAARDRPLGPRTESAVPPLLSLRIRGQPRINFTSDGEDPHLFLLMQGQQQQRFTAQGRMVADAYNIFSRAHEAEQRPLRELDQGSAHLLIPFPDKPTAGIESLGQMGDSSPRDYFGIDGNADQLAPIPGDRALLLTLSARHGADGARTLRAEVIGLNPRDVACVEIWGDTPGGGRARLATLTDRNVATFAEPPQLRRLEFRLVNLQLGTEISRAELHAEPIEAPAPREDERCLFRSDFVRTADAAQTRISGALTPPEGPFPQWRLPLIRWARSNTIRLTIPATPQLARVRLRLSARLHVRHTATLAISGNGTELQRVEFANPTQWEDLTVEFPAQPGENVIELRDVPAAPAPDWQDYLERYPDVKQHAEMVRQPLKEAALEHYRACGEREGRLMRFLTPAPAATDDFFFMYRQLEVEGLRP